MINRYICILIYWIKIQAVSILRITARQYGEVVLPDAASGHDPDTLAIKLSRCKEGMAYFLPSGYKFNEHYACRGTSLIGASKLSRYRMFVRGTGAVSRYKLSRSQKTVTMQNFNCVQMRVSGWRNHYKLV